MTAKWLTPVTDRSADDIANRTSKAFFNVSDWMRIYGNVLLLQTLERLMLGIDVSVTALDTVTTVSFPAAETINVLVGNINTVCLAAGAPGLTVLPDNYGGGSGGTTPDYQAVNAWEQGMEAALSATLGAADYQIFCGVAGAGQPRLWQARFHAPFAYVQPIANWKRKARSGNAVCGAGFERQNSWRRYA